MLPLRSPRRPRRPLLLPPGWVALGYLLLLGCGLLQAHWRQLRLPNVLQLTMPPLKQDTAGLVDYQRFSRSTDTPYTTPYQTISKLDKLRPWHTIKFGGQPLTDFFSSQAIEDAIKLINADSSHAGGVRVRFRAGATYANLVRVLDIMNVTNQKKYWLDNRHQPATFYAITNKELPKDPNQVPMFICGTSYHIATLPPPPLTWQRFLAEYWLPAWRGPWLLLLALGASNARKLGRATKTNDPAT